MNKPVYFPPESEVIEMCQEKAILTDSLVGRANVGYSDNEMEEL